MHSVISVITIIIELAGCVIAASSSHQNYPRGSCASATSGLYSNHSGPSVAALSFHGNQNNFPLPDGFPDPGENQLNLIEWKAFETLSNASLPANVSKNSLISLQLIAFNKLFEVVYFIKFLFNLRNSVEGYEIADSGRQEFIINTIIAVKNVYASLLLVEHIINLTAARRTSCSKCQQCASTF